MPDTLEHVENELQIKGRYRSFAMSWYVKDAESLELEAHVHPDGTRTVEFVIGGRREVEIYTFESNAALAAWCTLNNVPFSSCQYMLHLMNLALPSFLKTKGDL